MSPIKTVSSALLLLVAAFPLTLIYVNEGLLNGVAGHFPTMLAAVEAEHEDAESETENESRSRTISREHVRQTLEKTEVHQKSNQSPIVSQVASVTPVIDSSAHVTTAQDFNSFVAYVLAHDTRLSSVDIKDGSISLNYKEPAKLIWFVDSTVVAHIASDASGTVRVTYPWNHVFKSTDYSEGSLAYTLQSVIDSERQRRMYEQTKVGATSSDIVFNTSELFELITRTLKKGKS